MSTQFDLLIRDVDIVDGTGEPAFKSSIGIRGERIAALDDSLPDGLRRIDGSGLIACPGFIDIHSHGDLTILQYPLAEAFIMQGITTFVGGNCGLSMAPLKDLMPWGVFTSRAVGRWWHEVEPYSYGPPNLLHLNKYRKVLEEKLGFSLDWTTFDDFLSKVQSTGISVNYAPLVGHNSVRSAVMGQDFRRRARPIEIEEMKQYVEEALESGAFGLGVGLDASPGDFASTEELIHLAKVAQKYGTFYASHTRNFDNNYPSTNPEEWGYGICHNITPEEMPAAKYYGLLEAIEVSRKTSIPVEIAHICPAYTIYHHYPEILQEATAKATLELIEKAREAGLDISFDVLPDEDRHGVRLSQPTLVGLFSKWLVKCGSKERFVENLKIMEFREELRKEIMAGSFKILMIHPKTDYRWMDRCVVLVCDNKAYEGKTIGNIAQEKATDPFETLFNVILEDPDTRFSCEDPRHTESTLRIFLQHPASMIGADLEIEPFDDSTLQAGGGIPIAKPGLATYATYPRYIRKFVKERAILGLEEAIKKATYLPAQKIGLKDRGIITSGAYADILVFDLQKISDKGTWLEPRVRPEGITHVLVNGKVVYENMAHTGAKPGKVLRHK